MVIVYNPNRTGGKEKMVTKQLLKMDYNGHAYSIVYRYDRTFSPFVLYEHTYGHRKMLSKFANFESCLYAILDLMNHR